MRAPHWLILGWFCGIAYMVFGQLVDSFVVKLLFALGIYGPVWGWATIWESRHKTERVDSDAR